jgi:dienelactone hydrolase
MIRPPLIETPFSILNESGDTIRGDLRFAPGTRGAPLLLICHGFTAHKDWGPFPHIGRRLAGLGFVTAVFNFSHNGIGRNFRRFTEAEKFAHNTVGKELEDVRALVDAAASGLLAADAADHARIGIIGHSRGGGVALLAARDDARIRGVAAWSTVSTFHRYTAHQRETWEHQGFLPVTIRGVRTSLRFDLSVLRDLEAKKAKYDLRTAVRELRVPLLIVHGTADVAVKQAEAEELHAAADHTQTELLLLEGAGHAFGAAHPFHADNPTIARVIEHTAQWFHRILM